MAPVPTIATLNTKILSAVPSAIRWHLVFEAAEEILQLVILNGKGMLWGRKAPRFDILSEQLDRFSYGAANIRISADKSRRETIEQTDKIMKD
jgi:hypothetical protein